jgi:hypothetical protein
MVPEAEEGTQIGGGPAAQKGRGDRAILIAVVPPFDQAQGDHGIHQDAQPTPRDTCPLGELVQGSRTCRQVLKQLDFVGDKQKLGGHEPTGDLKDGVRCHRDYGDMLVC